MMKRPFPAFGIRDLPTVTFLGQTEGLGTYCLVVALVVGRLVRWRFGWFARCAARVVAVMLRVLLRFAYAVVMFSLVVVFDVVGACIVEVAGLAGSCICGGVPYKSLISC